MTDWTKFEQLYAAEKETYQAYRKAASGENKRDRVLPKDVERKRAAWHAAAGDLYAERQVLAAELGCRPVEVPRLYWAEALDKGKKVRR